MTQTGVSPQPLSNTLVSIIALCCGLIVANIYYAQPIIELLAPEVGLSPHSASFIVSLTQIGYALGLFFLVPLADLVENKRLMLITLGVSFLSLIGTALADTPNVMLILCLMIGISSVSVQVLIPLAAHLSSDEKRGQVLGNIMAGLLLGILLARPISSLIADHFGWRAVFYFAAGCMVFIASVIYFAIPHRHPNQKTSYFKLLKSLKQLMITQPVLRQRALFQALMFASFSLFWTSVPIVLAREYGLSQSQIALFALVGAAGAIAAPIVGRLADKGYTHQLSLLAKVIAAVCFLPSLFELPNGIIILALTGVFIDFAVQANMVLGQRAVYSLEPQSRARLNAIYMTSIFVGGAVGSLIASPLYEAGGWTSVALVAAGMPLISLIGYLLTNSKSAKSVS
ncbi:MFS transporter [Pseudoalteromonas carrageenovora]|uniref:MFS transporter n=1 Tax=Pseudoalteromonas carrageenovora TaxID=227 RepID=UPI0026E12AD4|nr:MFS transporter [Pseudoalteromonas carrageenovora]MDO6547145.1 MFS transporter [Pseudoalteromonas carrageenovora]MDO6831593.1 MFS transporter [Pseudoalteromonas carrageenovora]